MLTFGYMPSPWQVTQGGWEAQVARQIFKQIDGKNPRIGIFSADADELMWELKVSEKLLGAHG